MDPFIYHSGSKALSSFPPATSDIQPPRKKMRKGTKSCVECRRRKIRCTFSSSRPARCNECFSRGVNCIDQEHAPVNLNKSQSRTAEPSYSLRERVAVLESTVEDILRQLGEERGKHLHGGLLKSSFASASHNDYSTNCAPTPPESADSAPKGQNEQAPLLSLFDNHVVSRSAVPGENHESLSMQRESPKYAALRSLLLSLMPPVSDMQKILQTFPYLHGGLLKQYPEICGDNLSRFLADRSGVASPEALGDLAKLLILLVMAIDQSPASFNFHDLQVPLSAISFTHNVLSTVDRMIFSDDDIASTVSGIECLLFAGKHYMVGGRPRRAWRLFRRGIESAQLRGLHLSMNRALPHNDRMSLRHLYIWCSLVCCDRYMSLILGLPYAVPDRFVAPHMQLLEKTAFFETSEGYVYRLCLFYGGIIDRNQDPNNLSLPKTLQLDRELSELSAPFRQGSLDVEPNPGPGDVLLCHFVHNFTRVMLHLPFVLNSDSDAGSRYCRNAALESSRNCIKFYQKIRTDAGLQYTACKMIDFQMFTGAMLLGIHLLGVLKMPQHITLEDAEDWQMLRQAARLFREISSGPYGTVAAQCANVLEMLCGSPEAPKECRNGSQNGCKVTIPYFGTFYLRPGRKFGLPESCQQAYSPGSVQHTGRSDIDSRDYITPSTATPVSDVPRTGRSGDGQSPFLDDRFVSFENILALPNVDFDVSKIPNVDEDMRGWRMDPSLGLDLCLDQGWNLDWLDPSSLPSPPS
ncbi:hypothetical protein D8B26_007412 [Coccidioides posadasii str. Silveira]|uniref:Zn(2)-C6 fungal-type domain-containing protein n=1 Tax=Coccidioides posadasii (strain RMSCC 757 / Silveira) TaxID=443226 RepID=E9CV07_COCPS|nr:conserved hypothetical protein [Coccidioides posadasii str. Silveira]QVM12796.1 hypothetical protein D8B26_007412 [Coccidioides posadasii str. Silveira]